MEDLRHVLTVHLLHVLKLCSWRCCPYESPCTGWVRRYTPLVPFPRILLLSSFLSSHLRILDFWALGGLHKFPCASLTTLSFIDIHRVDRTSQVLRRFSLVLHGLRKTKLTNFSIAGTIFGFAIGEPSLEVSSWRLYDMALCFPIGSERKSLKWCKRTSRNSWFSTNEEDDSTRHAWKLPLVSMSARSTYLMWIFGSKLILSNNQSSATLWDLDTCLIVGLRPLIIILMTASLSSKRCKWDSPWEDCVLVGTWSTLDNCSTSRFLFSVGEWFPAVHKFPLSNSVVCRT